MRNIVLRRRKCKLQCLRILALLPLVQNVRAAVGKSDILSRCNNLQSNRAVLTLPTSASLPPDVANTLSIHSKRSWDELNDVTKVGLLWVHGYVFSGGFKNEKMAGDAIVQVYTRCTHGATTGIAMATIGLSYNDLINRESWCNVASCGSYYQTTTNTTCAANLTSAIQCAVNGASTALPRDNKLSFWSTAWSTSTIPYPQAFQHSITLNEENKSLEMYSIHMHNNDDAGSWCGGTPDVIIPCLRLENVTTTSATGVSGFCKPAVDVVKVKRFLESGRAIQLLTNSNANGSSDVDSNMVLILGLGIGGSLLLVLLVLILFCRCRHKTRRETAATPTFQEQIQTADTTQTNPRQITGRRGKNTSNNSSTVAINGNRQSNRARRLSWYTLNNNTNCESTIHGRWSSFLAGTWLRSGAGGKTASEYCKESQALTEFTHDPIILTKRIAYDELTFVRIISHGACGEVWLGQLKTQHVAIKRLLPERCQITANLEQFAREIELMCMLQHRNIVSFVGVGWNRLQNLCAVVEYMDAGDLAKVLKKNRETLSWYREKISIAMDVAEGLVYLHCMRPAIVHRDLKSKNVLLNRQFHAKLSDFGVSRKAFINETMTSGVGTLLWTAPEIIEGKKYSEKADVYSLGVVLSELDTCDLPFSDVTSDKGERLPGMQLAQLVRLNKIRVTLRKDCPLNLRKLIMECTQLDPDDRPSSMEVAFTLKSIIAPMLRSSSSMVTAASTSTSIGYSSSETYASQTLHQPSSAVLAL